MAAWCARRAPASTISAGDEMTLPTALGLLAFFLVLMLVLSVPLAARLVHHTVPPPRPRRFWLTWLVARELCTAGAAAAAAWIVLAESGVMPPWAAAAATGAVAYLVVEAVAPALGRRLSERVAERASEIVSRVIAVLRRPLERPAVVIASWLVGERGLAPTSVLRFAADGTVEEDEEAALDERSRALLTRVRAFRQRTLRDVITPRVRTVTLPADVGGPALLAALREQRFSRVPIHRGERDDVIGVLYAKDLLGRDVTAPGFRLEPLLRPATFIPLGTRAADVLRQLRRQKIHLAMVVDEYGGIAGLVTMEDLLEELFGEIRDEYDEAES
jgi:CBS domain containing-hemolysin-like protein